MLISLFDTASKTYGAPVVVSTCDEAKRNLCMVFLSGEKSMITTFPSHYQLFKIGDFDNVTGLIKPCAPTFIIDGLTAKADAIKEIQSSQLDETITPSLSGDEDRKEEFLEV